MRKLEINREPVNIEALDEELRDQIGSRYRAVSTRPNTVVVFFGRLATQAQLDLAEEIVVNHDSSSLSRRQQAQAQLRQDLADARDNYDLNIDLDDFLLANPLTRQLARTVRLLSLEIQALRSTME